MQILTDISVIRNPKKTSLMGSPRERDGSLGQIAAKSPDEIGDFYIQTIGFFDGVHAGHRFLLGKVKEEAERRSLKAMAVTFREPPAALLRPGSVPPLLTTLSQKLREIERCGIDAAAVLDFNSELARMSARDFMRDILYTRLGGKALLIGYDHRFGHSSSEGFADYQRYGREMGMDVIPAPEYSAPTGEHISSTVIRRMLTSGDVESAARLLTRPYAVEGVVVHGDGIGRRIGFPTANIRPDEPRQLLPENGAYAVRISLRGKTYAGMLYVGTRPTISSAAEKRVEVNLLDFNGDIYGQRLCVEFIARIRAEERFENEDALEAQLEKDREAARSILKSH